jgi:hypothetical protein
MKTLNYSSVSVKMKTLNFFLLLTIFSSNLYGQSIPMVSESNVWFERGQFGGGQEIHITHYFDGDTVINGLVYKKLYEDRRDTLYSTMLIQDNFSLEACMRQDGDLVFYVLPGDTIESLYADFNIELGDTLNYCQNTSNATVIAIDSIQIGQEYLTSYLLSNAAYFYEAIGGSFGPFRDFSVGIGGGTYLVCFSYFENSVGVGPFFNLFDCSPTYITVGYENFSLDRIKVYPNPTYHSFTLSTKDMINMNYTLLDIQGKVVLTGKIESSEEKVDISNLSRGQYNLVFEDESISPISIIKN